MLTPDNVDRRAEESRQRSISRLEASQWSRVTATVRHYLGDDFSEFCDLCAFANEHPNDPFMLRYVDDTERPKLLAQVRHLLVEHKAMLRRGYP